MRNELALPAFQMDCRDWLVITPSESGLPDEVAGTPLLAVLSTVVLDSDDFRSVSAVLTVGLLDEDDRALSYENGWTPTAVFDGLDGADGFGGVDDPDGGGLAGRYILPTPDRQLALLAEFTITGTADDEVHRRIDALMASFRWAA
jgi:hypothetical protein